MVLTNTEFNRHEKVKGNYLPLLPTMAPQWLPREQVIQLCWCFPVEDLRILIGSSDTKQSFLPRAGAHLALSFAKPGGLPTLSALCRLSLLHSRIVFSAENGQSLYSKFLHGWAYLGRLQLFAVTKSARMNP